MAVAEGLITALIYDGLKSAGKIIFGPYKKTFQKAQKKAVTQLKKEFSKGKLLSIFTTFNNMEWKLSFGRNARHEIEKSLIKGVKAINGQVFINELVTELHQNNKHYNIKLVEKIIIRFVDIVSQELKTNHEILNYLQKMDLEKIIEKIDSGFTEILEVQKRIEERLDGIERLLTGEKISYKIIERLKRLESNLDE
jgi:tRNA isopentenyl-2-thiomethyl-A-37 hydroxylase MiaE